MCFMNTYRFIVYTKTDGIYRDIAEDVETRFDILNYLLGRPLPKGKNKRVTDVIKDELGGKIMKEFIELRAKKYLTDNYDEDKNEKGSKKCVLKRQL